MSAAESLDEQHLYGCRKDFKCNIDMVEWFSQVWSRSDVVIDQHQARRERKKFLHIAEISDRSENCPNE